MVKLPLFLALLALLASDVFAGSKFKSLSNPKNECSQYEVKADGIYKNGILILDFNSPTFTQLKDYEAPSNSCKLPPKGQFGKMKPKDRKNKK